MKSDDPRCGVCGEPRSAHVATDAGPLTHPREARGEGKYVLVREAYTTSDFLLGNEVYVPPLYRFEPTPKGTPDGT